jgi:hypothetical protein
VFPHHFVAIVADEGFDVRVICYPESLSNLWQIKGLCGEPKSVVVYASIQYWCLSLDQGTPERKGNKIIELKL